MRRSLPPLNALRISSSIEQIDLAREDFDIALRAGSGRYPCMRADLILTESFFPVCSPALLSGPKPLRAPEDLWAHTLLHDEPRDLWQLWLKTVGLADIDATRGPGFSDSGMLIQAALEGQGVAIAKGTLAGDDLKAGRLVRPFDQSLPANYSYLLG